MSYVDVSDVRQHFRQNTAISDEVIAEYMSEEEYYVCNYLRVSTLPSGNPILKSVIRDLTVARCILNITSGNSDNYSLATAIRQEALRRLEQAKNDGFLPRSRHLGAGSEVYNPRLEPMFRYEDFVDSEY